MYCQLFKLLTIPLYSIQWNHIANMDKEQPLYAEKMVPPQINILVFQVLHPGHPCEVDAQFVCCEFFCFCLSDVKSHHYMKKLCRNIILLFFNLFRKQTGVQLMKVCSLSLFGSFSTFSPSIFLFLLRNSEHSDFLAYLT